MKINNQDNSPSRIFVRKLSGFYLIFWFAGCSTLASVEHQLKRDSSQYLDCPPSEVTITDYQAPTFMYNVHTWLASGCDNMVKCLRGFNAAKRKNVIDCENALASKPQSFHEVVIQKLSAQSGCPEEEIFMAEHDDKSGEPINRYRLKACGTWYVCKATVEWVDCQDEDSLE